MTAQKKLRHNPSRAEIHAHMYGVVRGDVEASPTMQAMARALEAKLAKNLVFVASAPRTKRRPVFSDGPAFAAGTTRWGI